jgi:hypothetical protein
MIPPETEHHPTDPETWSGLLAHWTTLAKAAVALPEDAHGARWRESIPGLIGLHALACALGDLGRLGVDEQALALDRAEVAIRAHARTVHEAWGREPLPGSVGELIDDARAALALARTLGLEATAAGDGAVMPDLGPIVERLLEAGFTGDLLAAAPGTRLARGCPAVFARPPLAPPEIDGLVWGDRPTPARQVYRRVEDDGAHDVVARLEGALLPGRPLLAHLVQDGRPARRPEPEDPAAQPVAIFLELAQATRAGLTTTTGSSGSTGEATSTE